LYKGLERFRTAVRNVLSPIRSAKRGGLGIDAVVYEVKDKRERLPDGYLEQVVRLFWWWQYLGGGRISKLLLRWYIADAFVTPKVRRSRRP